MTATIVTSTAAAVPAKGSVTAPQQSITAAVQQGNVQRAPVPPKSLKLFSTADLSVDTSFFHCCLYSETSCRKSTIAAQFGDPKNTLIILTRRKEQLTPLRDLNYEAVLVENADALKYALQYPEALWAGLRVARPELEALRTLILDDVTEGVNLLLDASEWLPDERTGDLKKVKDARRTYKAAGKDLRFLLKSVLNKPLNFIMVALARVHEDEIIHEQVIGPDVPPSIFNMLGTEVEFCFYVQPGNYYLLTDRAVDAYEDLDDETHRKKAKTRIIFAKSKLSLRLALAGKTLMKTEKPDLRALWNKVLAHESAKSTNP